MGVGDPLRTRQPSTSALSQSPYPSANASPIVHSSPFAGFQRPAPSYPFAPEYTLPGMNQDFVSQSRPLLPPLLGHQGVRRHPSTPELMNSELGLLRSGSAVSSSRYTES